MKVFAGIGLGILALALAIGAFAALVETAGMPTYDVPNIKFKVRLTPERVARGRKLANAVCVHCHLDPVTRKLTGRRVLDAPAEFGPVYSTNITRHLTKGIGSWNDGQIAYLLRTGVKRDGSYIPPYMPKLPHASDEDIDAIIAFLRSDDPLVEPSAVDPTGRTEPSFIVKMLMRVAWKPLPYPEKPIFAPEITDQVAYGKYLVAGLFDCYPCHSADSTTVDPMKPESTPGYLGGGNPVLDLRGTPILAANITFDKETGIGTWSEADLGRALRQGIRPDDTPIFHPMLPIADLTDEEISAIYAYLASVPRIRNEVPRAGRRVVAADGKE